MGKTKGRPARTPERPHKIRPTKLLTPARRYPSTRQAGTPSAGEQRELELLLMWEVGYGAGWLAGRQKLTQQLAERVDNIEATWRRRRLSSDSGSKHASRRWRSPARSSGSGNA